VPFKDREHLDDLRLDTIHDPVVALDDLTDAGTRELRHHTPHLRKPRQPIAALDDAMDESLRCGGVCTYDEVLDIDEARERLL